MFVFCNRGGLKRTLPLKYLSEDVLTKPSAAVHSTPLSAEQLERALKFPEWAIYQETCYVKGDRRHDRGTGSHELSQKAWGDLGEKKVFEGLDKKGIEKLSWEQIRIFLGVKKHAERSVTKSCQEDVGKRKLSDRFWRCFFLQFEEAWSWSVVTCFHGHRSDRGILNPPILPSVTGSRKVPITPIYVSLQCAGYALEMLTSGRARSHIIGMLVGGPNVQLQYYDRSMILKTRGLRISDENERRSLQRNGGIILNEDQEDVGMTAEEEGKSRNDPLAGMDLRLTRMAHRNVFDLFYTIFSNDYAKNPDLTLISALVPNRIWHLISLTPPGISVTFIATIWSRSSMYCYVFVLGYKRPGELLDASDKPPPFESWFIGTYDQVWQSKNLFIYRKLNNKTSYINIPVITDVITNFVRNFEPWAVGIYQYIKRGYLQEQLVALDSETIDGWKDRA
ncbi:hypothetical protein L218DRAFT_947103 [Marasmius fiardii PR-910]|nr:hypothetical protein L218DRAFT_947103 [Marasmius fiardii PR-910]